MIVAMQIKGIATERKQTTIKKNRSINDSFVFFFGGIGFIVFNYWNKFIILFKNSLENLFVY